MACSRNMVQYLRKGHMGKATPNECIVTCKSPTVLDNLAFCIVTTHCVLMATWKFEMSSFFKEIFIYFKHQNTSNTKSGDMMLRNKLPRPLWSLLQAALASTEPTVTFQSYQ